MKAIRIHGLTCATNPALNIDLQEILAALGAKAENAIWTVGAVEGQEECGLDATGSASSELEQLAQTGMRVSGKRLFRLAKDIRQVIWGKFVGYHASSASPWIIVIAFDSTWFEVRSADEAALARLKNSFQRRAIDHLAVRSRIARSYRIQCSLHGRDDCSPHHGIRRRGSQCRSRNLAAQRHG